MTKFYIIVGLLFFTTNITFANVVINEVAWMGTNTSVNDEWIELYNNGTSPVVIDGWTLQASDGSPIINLTGTISAGGFYLLERTDDTTVPSIPAGVIYSGSLSNDGETLVLKDNTEQIIETLSATDGWPAGNVTSKETMQRTISGTWITAIATPGATNATIGTTSSGTGNSSGSSGTNTTGTTTPNSTSSNVSPTSEKGDEDIVFKIEPDPKYSARMITPETLVQQVPLDFSSEVKKDGIINDIRGKFEWSMGDGGSFSFNQSTPFTYIYQEPGEYVIMLRYYSNVFKKNPDTIHQKTVTVIPATITVTPNNATNAIELTNKSTGDINLGKWELQRGIHHFVFPSYTILPKDKSLIISPSIHQLPYSTERISLTTPTGYVVKNRFINNQRTNSYGNSITKQQSVVSIENILPDNTNNEPEILYTESNTVPISRSHTNTSLLFTGLFGLLLFSATYGMKYLPSEESAEFKKD